MRRTRRLVATAALAASLAALTACSYVTTGASEVALQVIPIPEGSPIIVQPGGN